jgi:FdhE protein
VTRDTTSKILAKLKKQQKEEGKLPLLLEFYKELLQVQSRAQRRYGAPVLALSRETIRKRLQNGQPLLRFDELALDWSTVQDVFARITAAFAKYPQLFGEFPEKLLKPGASRLLTKKAAEAWFAGKELPRKIWGGVSENLLQAMVQATLQPFLAGYARGLIDSVEQGSWRRRYCPICGGSPDISFLEKEHGARWLVCSRCDSAWLFQRLRCPYCGNQEQKTLAFFTDDKELYRLYVCERCKCYLKAVDLRKIESEVLLPLERFYTLDLDAQAREYGYSPYLKPVEGENAYRKDRYL